MTDDKFSRSKTSIRLTRLKMTKYLCLLMSTLVWPLGNMQRNIGVILEYCLVKGSLS